MRTGRVAMALALLLVACSGSTRSDGHGAPSSAGGVAGTAGHDSHSVGGQPNGTAGNDSHSVGGQLDGTAGGPSLGAAGGVGGDASSGGVGAAGGVGGDASNGGVEPGSAGAGGKSTQCVRLDCLAGAHLVYQPTRVWHRPAGSIRTSDELSEADYTPIQGQPIAATFSDDAMAVELQETAGSTMMLVRNSAHTDRAWYEQIQMFPSGRFVVQLADSQFAAEYTLYGSGVPITSSTRGTLHPSP